MCPMPQTFFQGSAKAAGWEVKTSSFRAHTGEAGRAGAAPGTRLVYTLDLAYRPASVDADSDRLLSRARARRRGNRDRVPATTRV